MAGRETMVNSYDAGHQPYIHDPKRGKWEGQWDFFLSCVPNAFGIRSFLVLATFMQYPGAGYTVTSIFITTLLFVIPVFFVQSFLGQFSSTGFISVFRISPMFKGVGYVILVLNILTAIYNSSVAALPFLFLLKSFQLSATWMHCGNSWNTENCTEHLNESSFFPHNENNVTDALDPQFEYFLREVLKLNGDPETDSVSWTIILGQVVVWVLVWCVVSRGIATLGRFLRYSVLTCMIIVSIIFIRVCFLPNIGSDTFRLFTFNKGGPTYLISWLMAPVVTVFILGRGWGTTLTMASFQHFKANTERYSFVIPLVLTALSVAIGYMVTILNGFISRRSLHSLYYSDYDQHEYLFVAIPYFCGHLEAPQLWSALFFLMFFLSELSLVIIQTVSTVTAITDEYVRIREWKWELTAVLCSASLLFSMPFATEYLVDLLKQLIVSSYFNKMTICFLEIIIVVWIYGRERFVRDVRFMLVRNVAVWKFYIIRFVAPIFIFLLMLIYLANSIFHLFYIPSLFQFFVILLKFIPWIGIPGYAIFKLVTSIGTMSERFRKCVKPNDWYPADSADKQKYELALGTSDISQQLLEMNDNNDV